MIPESGEEFNGMEGRQGLVLGFIKKEDIGVNIHR